MQAYSSVQFPAMTQPEAGVLAWSIWGAGRSGVPPVNFPTVLHLVPPRTIAKPSTRPKRAARVDPAKLSTLPYNFHAPGALTPEQRNACLDGLVDTLLDIFLAMSPEEQARYRRPKE
jgi:hypothetical protein